MFTEEDHPYFFGSKNGLFGGSSYASREIVKDAEDCQRRCGKSKNCVFVSSLPRADDSSLCHLYIAEPNMLEQKQEGVSWRKIYTEKG